MTQINTLQMYIAIIEFAQAQNCKAVEVDFQQMVDDLEYQIINTYLNEVA